MAEFIPQTIVSTDGIARATVATNGRDVLDQDGNRIGVYFDLASYTALLRLIENLEDARDAYAALASGEMPMALDEAVTKATGE